MLWLNMPFWSLCASGDTKVIYLFTTNGRSNTAVKRLSAPGRNLANTGTKYHSLFADDADPRPFFNSTLKFHVLNLQIPLDVKSLHVVEVDTENKPGKIYDGYKSDDGFLYIAYSAENTLG
ncbi:hypothetical protein AK812_SmicGene3462 [Symbiodinium microadriaticum]|uniref:Uncharacterized protein n=1 Tax=Symbiodinium microadriaticum TaxID=2951 RepID=A0A1Q9EYT1_SYMMI|nr:hypothetical protein AK812_SmicGene3462 [Symbiodinium microadriaticum]